ncbi:hypothetical protein AB1Y20_015107 [Prymnesium parvum]|uniref:Integrase catalytic domain-containing protein n=1 Tax=Prymnesium parvum TaxID=97485 RepID=A0AB34JVS2_PRYPA
MRDLDVLALVQDIRQNIGEGALQTSSRYQPSHVGRLVHADIVGPFISSRAGAYKYALILVDDYSRFKSVKFLQAKSDAPSAVRSFVSELNAGLRTRSVAPIRVVGTLHTDNAGEFLSREFAELLDESLISHTTCPPHVHQLNGVAERAIRSVLQLSRAYLTSSGVAVQHWPEAFEMAVDVLNRTSGPPNSAVGGGPSSYEVQSAADIHPGLLKDYQSLVGAMLYCAVNTRPDIAYAVGMLCRAMGKPTPQLYECALQVLYYLHHHRGLKEGRSADSSPSGGRRREGWVLGVSAAGVCPCVGSLMGSRAAQLGGAHGRGAARLVSLVGPTVPGVCHQQLHFPCRRRSALGRDRAQIVLAQLERHFLHGEAGVGARAARE